MGVGEAFDVLRHVRQSVYAFGLKTDFLLRSADVEDLRLLGPFCARVLMETGCGSRRKIRSFQDSVSQSIAVTSRIRSYEKIEISFRLARRCPESGEREKRYLV